MLYGFYQNSLSFVRRIISGRRPLMLTAIFLLLFFLFFITPFFLFASDGASAIKPLIKGDYAPAVTLISTGSLKETIIDFNPAASASASSMPPALVWFWFISCENCIRDMKFMREIHKKYSSKLSLIAVNVDSPDARGPVKNFIKNNGISAYQNYYDKITETPFSKSYDASDKFGITATPAVFLIDKAGRIVLRAESVINFDVLEDCIETLLSE